LEPVNKPKISVTTSTTVTVNRVVRHGDRVVSDTTTVNGVPMVRDAAHFSRPAAPSVRTPAMDTLDAALAFTPMPRRGAQKTAWLMDAYSRLLKAEAAADALANDWRDGKITQADFAPVRQRLFMARRAVEDADKKGDVKKAFFTQILPPTLAVIDGLAAVPAPPADKAGKQAWLEAGVRKLQEARAADAVLRDAWINYNQLEFGQMTDRSRQLAAFERRLTDVARELNPPAPRPPAQPTPSTGGPTLVNRDRTPGQPGAFSPLFGNTQGVSNALNQHPNNPVVQVGAAVAMPFAVMIDVLDAITRPFVWMDKVSNGGK
jgi:hypothetical protein